MFPRREIRLALAALLAGAGLTAALNTVLFGSPGRAWAFGAGLATVLGVAGLALNRRALARPGHHGVMLPLVGGLVRVIVLLVAWRIGARAGLAEAESGAAMMGVHLAFMVAEIVQAAGNKGGQNRHGG